MIEPKSLYTRREFLKKIARFVLAGFFLSLNGSNSTTKVNPVAVPIGSEMTPATETVRPKIDLDIYLTAHAQAGDFLRLKELFNQADVFAMETIDADSQYVSQLKAIATGEKRAEDIWPKDVYGDLPNKAIFDLLYGSNKPVYIIDVYTQDRAMMNEYNRTIEGMRINPFSLIGETFEDKLLEQRNALKAYANFQRKREDLILSRLFTDIINNPYSIPDIKVSDGQRRDQEKPKKVLYMIGITHTRFGDVLSRNHQGLNNVRLVFDEPVNPGNITNYLSYQAEAAREYDYADDLDTSWQVTEPSDETIARAWLENDFNTLYFPDIQRDTDSSLEAFFVERNIISKFSYADIKKIYDSVSQYGQDCLKDGKPKAIVPAMQTNFFQSTIRQVMLDKGIVFPLVQPKKK